MAYQLIFVIILAILCFLNAQNMTSLNIPIMGLTVHCYDIFNYFYLYYLFYYYLFYYYLFCYHYYLFYYYLYCYYYEYSIIFYLLMMLSRYNHSKLLISMNILIIYIINFNNDDF